MRVPQNGRFAGFSLFSIGLFSLPALLHGSDAYAAQLTTLHGFCAEAVCADGNEPQSALVRDASGNLFGVTLEGGDENWGTVFELKRKGNGKYDYARLYTFDHDTVGFWPDGPLILDTKGNLYGAISEGGNGQCGSIFELMRPRKGGSWTLNRLHTFCSDPGAGASPNGGLTYAGQSAGAAYDGASALYGSTFLGGDGDAGVVFALTRHGKVWTETVLHSFCANGGSPCPDGAMPLDGVILDEAGNLYGATYGGGIAATHFRFGAGIVFELSPAGSGAWTETVLHTFCTAEKCADGAAPRGSLVLDAAGNLFGTTESGGKTCHAEKGGCGTVYKIVPAGADSQQTVLYAFCQKKDCKDGDTPEAGLMLDASGDLYGTTYFGGANLGLDQFGLRAGTVFRISGASYHVVYSFCALANCADGANPSAAVIPDPSGLLYGTTESGGPNGGFEVGTAFQLQP